jgi:hypothetical protein
MKKRIAGIFFLVSAILLSWVIQPGTAPCTESPQMAAMMLHPDNPFPPIMMKVRAEHMQTFRKYPAKQPIVEIR